MRDFKTPEAEVLFIYEFSVYVYPVILVMF